MEDWTTMQERMTIGALIEREAGTMMTTSAPRRVGYRQPTGACGPAMSRISVLISYRPEVHRPEDPQINGIWKENTTESERNAAYQWWTVVGVSAARCNAVSPPINEKHRCESNCTIRHPPPTEWLIHCRKPKNQTPKTEMPLKKERARVDRTSGDVAIKTLCCLPTKTSRNERSGNDRSMCASRRPISHQNSEPNRPRLSW